MKCPNCGKEIANDSLFCEYCGEKINFAQSLHHDNNDKRKMTDSNESYLSLESNFLNRGKLTWQQREQIAKVTKNEKVIDRLLYDNSKRVLEALLSNPNIQDDIKQMIRDRLDAKISSQEREEEDDSKAGCFATIYLILLPSLLIALLLFLIT